MGQDVVLGARDRENGKGSALVFILSLTNFSCEQPDDISSSLSGLHLKRGAVA